MREKLGFFSILLVALSGCGENDPKALGCHQVSEVNKTGILEGLKQEYKGSLSIGRAQAVRSSEFKRIFFLSAEVLAWGRWRRTGNRCLGQQSCSGTRHIGVRNDRGSGRYLNLSKPSYLKYGNDGTLRWLSRISQVPETGARRKLIPPLPHILAQIE